MMRGVLILFLLTMYDVVQVFSGNLVLPRHIGRHVDFMALLLSSFIKHKMWCHILTSVSRGRGGGLVAAEGEGACLCLCRPSGTVKSGPEGIDPQMPGKGAACAIWVVTRHHPRTLFELTSRHISDEKRAGDGESQGFLVTGLLVVEELRCHPSASIEFFEYVNSPEWAVGSLSLY